MAAKKKAEVDTTKALSDPGSSGGDSGEQNLLDGSENHPVKVPAHAVTRGVFDKAYLDDEE